MQLRRNWTALFNEYRDLITRVVDHVRGWEWNDPVSVLYGKLFSADLVFDTSKPPEQIKAEHRNRFAQKIPPGYKDEGKDDQGIGDFLIWLTILELGSTRKTSLIFVTGEEKADWWHRSEQQQLYPRFELVDEYRRASEGRSFHIIRFSRFLELFGASNEVIAEVREEENLTPPSVPISAHSALRIRALEAERAVSAWLVEQGYKVSPASMRSGYDFVVEGDSVPFAVEVLYVRTGSGMAHRLGLRHRQFLEERDLPVTVIVVAERVPDLEEAERVWSSLDSSYRLSTGLLTEDGRFRPRKPM